MQYNYDSSGAIFSYFLVTLFTLTLVPYTILQLFTKETTQDLKCNCQQCVHKQKLIKKRKKGSNKWLYILFGWLLFSGVLYTAFTVFDEEPELWDPYRILGVEKDADESTVKKAYKKLSMKYHPDKLKEGDNKEEFEAKFIEITKANKVLTDAEAKLLFDEFGHPDGKQAFTLGLALPSWLVQAENSSLVLLVYTLLFGLGLPVMVAKWWSSAKVMSKFQILNITMANYYRDLTDSLDFKGLLNVLIKAQEYEELALCDDMKVWNTFERKVIDAFEVYGSEKLDLIFIKKSPLVTDKAYRALLLISGHMLRVKTGPALEMDMADVVEISGKLIAGLLQIATSRNWLRVSLEIINLSQLMTQAMLPGQSEILQLPNVTNGLLAKFEKKQITKIDEYLNLDLSERKELLKGFGDFEIFNQVASTKIPSVHIAKAEYTVAGESHIVPSSLVTLSVKFKCGFDAEPVEITSEIPEQSHSKKKVEQPNDKKPMHSPYYPIIRKPTFYVFLTNPQIQRMICMTKSQGLENEHIARLQFQSPPEPGSWTFQCHVKSDSFIGIDHIIDMELTVEPADVIPPIVEYNDETTDDEYESEDEVPVVKPKKKKAIQEKAQFEDSTDSDELQDEDEWVDGDFVE